MDADLVAFPKPVSCRTLTWSLRMASDACRSSNSKMTHSRSLVFLARLMIACSLLTESSGFRRAYFWSASISAARTELMDKSLTEMVRALSTKLSVTGSPWRHETLGEQEGADPRVHKGSN
eukprot:1546006-Alexandrium_andersonii.AAC.1